MRVIVIIQFWCCMELTIIFGLRSLVKRHPGLHPEEDLKPILREKVEIAVAALKKGKSAGVDNIPTELVQAGGESMINVLKKIRNKIWKTGESQGLSR